MFGKRFVLNEQSLTTIAEIGKHMPGGFFIYKDDENGELIYFNDAVLSLYGCANIDEFKAFTGNCFKGMVHPEDYPGVKASIDEQIKGKDNNIDYAEFRIVTRNGDIKWIDDHGHFTKTDLYGGIYYVFISDITEKKRQAELKEQEANLELRIKLLAEERQSAEKSKMITALSSDYWSVYYVEVDKDLCTCYQAHPGVKNGIAVGQTTSFLSAFRKYAEEYIAEEYRESFLKFIDFQNIKDQLKDKRMVSLTYLVKHDGCETYEMIKIAGVRHPEDRDDGIVHAIGVGITDVDEETRRNLQANRALSEALITAKSANAAKSAFLSSMSHEIRTPMNAIIGMNAIALNNPEISEKTRDQLMKIGNSAEYLLDLINDILDMSRIESGRMLLKNEEFGFAKLIRSINAIFTTQCHDKGIHYECVVGPDVADYYIGDIMKLRQIIVNILGNAVKFTPEGGKVSLHVRMAAHFADKTTLEFVMSDSGIGMSSEFLPRIFESFAQEDSSTTNRFGGTGLGLAITKGIVDIMNGDISVESEKGKGTTFRVKVTLLDSHRGSDKINDTDTDIHGLKILIVDDSVIDIASERLALEKEGVDAEVASNGKEAIEMVRLSNARQKQYNLILVDYLMSEMDGIATVKKMKEFLRSDQVVLMITAAILGDATIDEARSAGVDGFVSKPLDVNALTLEYAAAIAKRANQEETLVDLKGKNILVAEDIEINAEIITCILETEGMIGEVANNGLVALNKFKESPVGHFDAILMDMRMPEMDGVTATKEIRKLDRPDAKTIPIIALTANAFDEDVQTTLQAGMNAHLTKPVQGKEITETLKHLLR